VFRDSDGAVKWKKILFFRLGSGTKINEITMDSNSE